MSFLKEFREFAVKGNVIDMAVGVIIGGAFGKIVTSLVNDMVMPTLGIILAGVDFKELSVAVGDSQIKYGLFIQSVVDFLIIALVIFLAIKQINRFKRKHDGPAPASTEEVALLREIRDAVKK